MNHEVIIISFNSSAANILELFTYLLFTFYFLLFTDTAAILNLLDLRCIMGCDGGMSSIRYTRSVFTRAFRANF